MIDTYSRRILGGAAYPMKTSIVLDALEQAIWTWSHEGVVDRDGLVRYTDAGGQCTSIAFTERLAAAGVDGSVGSVGAAYDNAFAETVIGLYKTELIKRQGPCKTSNTSSSRP